MTDGIAISIRNLYRSYTSKSSTVTAVNGVSLDIKRGEFYTLLGPSGCGKTTTLRCVAGLERPQGGEIELEGVTVVSRRKFVPAHDRGLGMVFQDYAVWPHMTAFDNVAFPLRIRRVGKKEVEDRVLEMLDMVGLAEMARRPATRLSGGQQQRLSLARALVSRPSVLLLDEPLSNLDARLRDEMRAELRSLQRRLGVTTVFVTHDQVEALTMSNRIAVMQGGEVVQEGTPRDIYLSPADEFVAGFVGATNFVLATGGPTEVSDAAVRIETEIGSLVCRGGAPEGSDVAVAIRPEAISIAEAAVRPEESTDNCLTGEVTVAIFTGALTEYQIEVAGKVIKVATTARDRHRRGDVVSLRIPASECVPIIVNREPAAASAMDEPAPDDSHSPVQLGT